MKTTAPKTGPWAPPKALYYLIFTISGFSGLIYESIWSHYLKLFLGHAAYAQSLVLTIFMGGMAVGAWLAGQYSHKWRTPILVYAIVEAVIGVLALIFHGSFVAITDTVYSSLLPATDSALAGHLLKWGIAALMIVPQSILLGMTFPLMTAGIIRRYPDNSGSTISLLYFTNSIGAAVGVLASGFWLIAAVGLPGTIITAGVINILLAGTVALLVRRDPAAATAALSNVPQANAERSHNLLLTAAFVTGLASFIYEIGWIRMLSLVLSSATHSFELMLSAFIMGLAFGGLWIRGRIDKIASPLKFAAYVQLAMGLLALATLPLYGYTFDWMATFLGELQRTPENYKILLFVSHGVALAVMLPATFCAGMTLPLFTHALLKSGYGEKSIGRIYAFNTLGSIVGVLFAVNIGLPFLGVKYLIGAGALIDAALGLLLLYLVLAPGRERLKTLAESVAVVACSAVVILTLADITPAKLASGVFRYNRAEVPSNLNIYYYRDGKTASVNVHGIMGKGLTIGTNGKPDATLIYDPSSSEWNEEDTMVMLGAMPLGFKPDTKTVAIVGMGSGLTTHTVLGVPGVERVDTIEIEPAMVEGARLFGHRVARAYDDSRSHIHIEDAKTFFAVHNRKYDVIISEPSNPWISGVSSLYSREYYRHVRNYLQDDGLLVQWIHLYESDVRLVVSILKAMDGAFADYALYFTNSHDMLIVARKTGALPKLDTKFLLQGPLREDLKHIGIRNVSDLQARQIMTRKHLVGILLHYDLVPANSDYYPYLDLNAHRAFFMQRPIDAFTQRLFDFPFAAFLNGAGDEVKNLTENPMFYSATNFRAAQTLYKAMATSDAAAIEELSRDFQQVAQAFGKGAAQCARDPQGRSARQALHYAARFIVGNLESREVRQLFQSRSFQACASSDPGMRQWLDFYESIAQRNAPRVAQLADALLQREAFGSDRDLLLYVVSASVVGNYLSGNEAKARTAWDLLVNKHRLAERAPFYLETVVRNARR